MESERSPMVRSLAGMRELSAATDEVIGVAKRESRVFDRDLAEAGYNSVQRFERLRAFLLGNRGARLSIVVHNVGYLERECPRMQILLRQFSHAIDVRRTLEQAKAIYDGFLVADQAHYVHRFHAEQARGEIGTDDEVKAALLIRRFQEIWECSEPALSATVLGL